MLRDRLWEDLCSSVLEFDGPWLSMGDYNAVVSNEEVSRGANLTHYRCGKFTNWIFNQGFMDVGFSRARFTWSQGLNNSSFKGARLDRGLCNVE